MKRYFADTRTYSYSLLFALPLLLLYEAGAIYIAQADGAGFRNAADVMLRSVLLLGGVRGTLGVTTALIGVAVILIILERRRRSVRIRFRPFVAMAGESVLYAGLLGIVVGSATQFVVDGLDIHLAIQGFASMTMIEGLVLSIGAGLYEELVFRVLVAGGLFAVFRWSGVPVGRAGAFAVIVSALVFSAFHYIGPFGDTLALSSFLFRFFAGVVFSAIFLLRGFGIAAWTHALYDIFIVVALNA